MSLEYETRQQNSALTALKQRAAPPALTDQKPNVLYTMPVQTVERLEEVLRQTLALQKTIQTSMAALATKESLEPLATAEQLHQWLEQTQAVATSEDMIAAISVYLVIAVISTALAVCVLVWLCRNQGREEYVIWLLRERKSGKKKGKLISIPLIIAIVICLGYMILNVVWQ